MHATPDECLPRAADFWWELLEAWKKLFLVGFAVIILPGSIEQLLIGLLTSLSYGLLVAVVAPFAVVSDDQFSKACSFALTVLFAFCIVLKVSA